MKKIHKIPLLMFLIISLSLFLINLIEFPAFNYEIKSISATEFEKNNQKKVDTHNEMEIRNETTLSNNITLNNFFGEWTGTIEFFHFQFGLDELGNRIIKDVSKYSENEYNFLERSGDLFYTDVEEPGYCHITEGPISNDDVARENYESNSLKQFSKKNLQLAVSGNNLSGSMEICVYSGNMDDNTTNSYGVFNVDVNLKIINENTLEGEYIWENEPFSIYLTRDEIWQKILKELGTTPTDEDSYREVVYLMNNATLLYNEEKYYDALAKYDKILQSFTKFTRALEGKSLSLIYLGKYEDAEKILNTVIQLEPENEELKKHKENLLSWQKSAKNIGNITLTPKEINSIIEELNKSIYLSNDRNYNESIVKTDEILGKFPNYIDALLHKAVVLLNLGEYSEAYSYLKRVLELDPNNEKAKNLIEELKKYLESVGKSLADLEDKSRTKTDVKLNQTLPFNSNISSNLSNLGNATIIDGLPVTISLVYKDGKLDFANNVIYKVKFDIPNEDFTIKKYDKGTFENVSQIDRNTFIFKTKQIVKDETKSGLVVFNFKNSTNNDRKISLSAEVTINGKTQTTIIDPNPQSYLDIGTKVVQLSRDTFELGQDFYHGYVSCVNMNQIKEIAKDPFMNPQWEIEIENCSDHPQLTILKVSNLPTFINDPIINPFRFDIPSQSIKNSILKLIVDSDHIAKNEQITFTVSADVIWNFFGNDVKVASTSANLFYSIRPPPPPPQSMPNINILKNVKDCTNEDFLHLNNINPNTPQLISLTESLVDNQFSNSNNFLIKKLCIRGYENIETIRSPVDIIFSIDSSKSMKRNDKDNLRLEAVKSFIDKLDPNIDRAGFVGWAGNIKSLIPLTSDFLMIKNEIEKIQLDAGTNLNLGLQEAIKLFNEGADLSDLFSDKTNVILFLSDGEGDYTRSDIPDSITNIASSLGHKVFSIGLNIDNIKAEVDLKDMASATGGKYYASPVAKNLDEIFNNIYKSIIRTNSPNDVDLTILLPNNVISNNNFSIEPTKIMSKENTQIEWENISQHVGNKDEILTEDEIFTVAYIKEKLPSIDGEKIGNKISINYTDISNGEKKVEFNNID